LSDVPAQTKNIFKNRKIFISDRLVALPVTFLKLATRKAQVEHVIST
jgi:hypothetical protein